jgi:WD40 repeat protein
MQLLTHSFVRRFLCVGSLFALIGAGSSVGSVSAQTAPPAAQPPAQPILRIETGMHTVTIRRIGVDAAGRYLVTGSNDKTVRVWELATGRLLRTLRPPIGAGNEGKVGVVAISPDGRLIAAAGWTGIEWDGQVSIYLFDRESGRLKQRMGGLPEVVGHLAFSPDGTRLAVALLFGGIRVFRVADGTEVGRDTGYGDQSYGLDFDRAGRLVTSCFDGYLRLYDQNLKLIRKVRALGGQQPYAVRFAPDGLKVAVGYLDSTAVGVLDGRSLEEIYRPDATGVSNGNLMGVAWSADGSALYAGGEWRDRMGVILVRRWAGAGQYQDLAAAGNRILDLASVADGSVVFGAADPAWGVFSASGRRVRLGAMEGADYRENQEGFLTDATGGVVGFAYELFGKSPARFSLAERRLEIGAIANAPLRPPRINGLAITGWKFDHSQKVNDIRLALNGVRLALGTYERPCSLAIAPDAQSFLLGAEFYLRLFDRGGNLRWMAANPAEAWGVNISGDGKLAIAAYGDGTIRWFRMADGKELLAFFPHKDRKRWALWTPSGYYDCSPGAEDLIGWHVNNGKDAAADFYPISRFRSAFYRPDVIDLILQTLDEGKAVEQANLAANRRRDEEVLRRRPPVIQLVDPVDQIEARQSDLTIRYRVRTPAGGAVTSLRVLVDSRPVAAAKGQGARVTAENQAEGTVQVALPPRDCVIELIAENANGPSVPAVLRVNWRGVKPEDIFKPTLYVLAVGVNRYQSAELDPLRYAAKDARDFAAAWQRQKGHLYREVVIKLLTDEDATKNSVLAGFDWLSNSATSRDVAVVLLSGHGLNDRTGRNYFYMTSNSQPNNLLSTAVSFADIRTVVENLPCKVAFFLDTCHSGAALGTKGGPNVTEVLNELSSAENGAVVFASSTGRQRSLEKDEWRNGAFTKAVVEGLNGKADVLQDGRITLSSLDLWIANRVKELTGGQQAPVMLKPGQAPNYPLAVRIP